MIGKLYKAACLLGYHSWDLIGFSQLALRRTYICRRCGLGKHSHPLLGDKYLSPAEMDEYMDERRRGD